MRYVITIIKKIFPKDAANPVGRWKIEQCNKKMNFKIDLSNEDHCGPCGESELLSIPITKEIKKKPQNSRPFYRFYRFNKTKE